MTQQSTSRMPTIAAAILSIVAMNTLLPTASLTLNNGSAVGISDEKKATPGSSARTTEDKALVKTGIRITEDAIIGSDQRAT